MNLEDRLRETLADDRRALPGWGDATERVRHGVTRRRRHRRYAVAAAAVVVALLVGVPTLLATQRHTALPPGRPSPGPSRSASPGVLPSAVLPSGVVPWLDAPATAPVVTVSRSTRPTASPCLAGDLGSTAAVLPEGGGAGGTQVVFVALHNTGHRTCTLGGYPSLLVKNGSGTFTALRGTNEYPETPDGGEDPATLLPGEYAQFAVRTSLSCNGGVGDTVVANLYLRVDGRDLPVQGLRLDYTCPGIGVGRWYRLMDPVAPVAGALTTAGVTARIDASATVVAGGTLEYQVVLTNPGADAVPLVPCPVYEQDFYKSHGVLSLNCAATNLQIPGHSSIRYAMRIAVPPYTPPGPWTVSWHIDEASGPTASATAQVTVTTG